MPEVYTKLMANRRANGNLRVNTGLLANVNRQGSGDHVQLFHVERFMWNARGPFNSSFEAEFGNGPNVRGPWLGPHRTKRDFVERLQG
jgi:hypothetical protein